jgi:hypothetical protein
MKIFLLQLSLLLSICLFSTNLFAQGPQNPGKDPDDPFAIVVSAKRIVPLLSFRVYFKSYNPEAVVINKYETQQVKHFDLQTNIEIQFPLYSGFPDPLPVYKIKLTSTWDEETKLKKYNFIYSI